MRRNEIALAVGGVAAAVVGAVFGPKLVKKAFAEADDPVISPVEAGILSFANEEELTSGQASSLGGKNTGSSGVASASFTPEEDQIRVTIPLDETEEFSKKIGQNTVEVVFEAPELFVSTESGQIVPTLRTEVVTNNVDGTPTTQTVFVDQFGNTFGSEQELLNAAVKISDEVNAALQSGTSLSVIEAIIAGKPVNTTNFITERPTFFPEAQIDSEFQRRAQALGATLTADNPGGSSSARIANFSRLAALGTDLSQVDPFGVQNPDFLREIKTGQGPLSQQQKQLLDQVRLSIDPRNMTSSDFEEIRRNQERRAAEKLALEAEVAALKRSGLTPEAAKDILNRFGFAVRGPVTLELFATLNDRFGQVQQQQPAPQVSEAKQFDVQKNLESAVATVSGAGTRSQQIDKLSIFLRQTGRSNLDNLAPAELFALNRAGFSNVNPSAGSNQPAVNALKLLLLEVK